MFGALKICCLKTRQQSNPARPNSGHEMGFFKGFLLVWTLHVKAEKNLKKLFELICFLPGLCQCSA